jgi:6-phosphogluconolactonase (cycloisomerase 2 family)
MLSITATGGLLTSSSVIDPTGSSIYVSEGLAGFTPTGNYAGISGLAVDSTSGNVSVMASSPFQLASNSQPCEIAIDPAGRYVYTALVNADAVAGFTRDSSSGALTSIPGSPFPTSRAASQTCDLAMHPSGRFLYALNLNGHDIAGYSIDATGTLTPLPGSPYPAQVTPDVFKAPFTQGPIAVDPSGKFLYVLTTEKYIAVYSINQNTGALSISGSPRATPAPVQSLNIFKID